MKKYALLFVKLAVSAGLIALLLRKIPLGEIAAAFRSSQLLLMAIGLTTGPIILLISAVNTKILLDAQGVRMRLSKIFEINYSAEFYNFLVPGLLSGGLIRWHQFSRSSGRPAASLATVAFIRLWDTIILLGIGSLLWSVDPVARHRGYVGISLYVATAALLAITLLAFNKRTTAFIEKRLNRMKFIPVGIRRKMGSVLESVRVFDTNSGYVLPATIGLTIGRNLCGISAYFLFAQSLSIPVSAVNLGWMRSVVHGILLLPISFSGIGIREGGMVFFLRDYEVDPAAAVALSFLLLMNTIGVRVIGAVVAVIKVLRGGGSDFIRDNGRQSATCRSICYFGTRLASENTGDNAVFMAVRETFQRHCSVRFTVFSNNPERIRRLYRVDAYSPKRSIFKILNSLSHADLVLIGGGTPLYNAPLNMLYKMGLVFFAKLCNKRVVIFGISLRPSSSAIARFCIKRIINMVDMALAREHMTLKSFKRLARNKPGITTLPDPASQLLPVGRQEALSLLKSAGVDMKRPIIGVWLRNFIVPESFSKKVYAGVYRPQDVSNLYERLSETVTALIKQRGCSVVCIPMSVSAPDDDRVAGRELYWFLRKHGVQDKVILIENQFSPSQIKGIAGAVYASLCVRFHSLVFASSMHVPHIAIGYDAKHVALMNYVGMPEFCTSVRRLRTEFLNDRVERIFSRHDQLVKRLQDRYEQIDTDYNEKVASIFKMCGVGEQA